MTNSPAAASWASSRGTASGTIEAAFSIQATS